MATNTYVALDKVTVGTAVSTVTFSSINQGYTDLVVVCNLIASSSTTCSILTTVNGDSGSNYSNTVLTGNGSSASSGRDSSVAFGNVGYLTSANPTVNIVQYMNYSNATTYKTFLNRSNDISFGTRAGVSLWRNTAAITSITFANNGGVNFAAGSTFSLYGIKAADVGAKATGGVISSDATYWYHTFANSGTFTPTQSLTCDFLVVAGGGGGASGGGAGGAGGYRTSVGTSGRNSSAESALSVTAQAYTITVGAGGAGGVGGNDQRYGTVGSNSTFSTITSNGGGYGGSYQSGFNSGSGGSGGGTYSSSSTPGTGTTGQGYDVTAYGRGGGAGAGSTNSLRNGGAGLTSSITGLGYAGGGASSGDQSGDTTGTATHGGGTAAPAYSNNVSAGNGTANTGGGGGGGGGQTGVAFPGTAGTGGSGVVVIRYAK